MKLFRARIFSRGAAIAHDLVMIPVAWLLSYWFRFNLEVIPSNYFESCLYQLILVVPIQAAVFWLFGLYRGVWRFASMPDLFRIIKGAGAGTVLLLALLFVFFRLEEVPRSVPILYGLFLIILLSGPRFIYRWSKDHKFYFGGGRKVLIVGAGHAGEMLVRDLLRNQSNAYQPIAFVDDDVSHVGRDLHGVPVLGVCSLIPELVRDRQIDLIMLAVPGAKAQEKRRLIELCEESGVIFRTVPQLDELMTGQVAINQVREVSIEDLLGREPVKLDRNKILEDLGGRSVLVTGAGGSIGSELCRQVCKLNPSRLILLENSEFNLYSIEMELSRCGYDFPVIPCLSDIRDSLSVELLFKRYKPQVVFHAAAYKHVPLLESQMREAVLNNILGTRNVADAADRHQCSHFLLVSTDKAVNPSNVMGSTKRVAEVYCQNLNERSTTRYITVRFGNVLGSAGSVVPLFRHQIASGGPVTVTHPDIERFFMTIPEACELITQAVVLGRGGEIFVLDMGESVKIKYLAEQMILLSGKKLGEDIEIIYTGLRPGEKLYEELFHEQEALLPTGHSKILLSNYRKLLWDEIEVHIGALEDAVVSGQSDLIMSHLDWFVPENSISKLDSKQIAESWL